MTRLNNDLISRKALLEEINIQPQVLTKGLVRHLITNAPTIEADSGEAVAVKEYDEDGKPLTHNDVINKILPCGTKLFTSPQKQWVELTDEQIKKIINDDASWTGLANPARVAKAIQSKLKEVNHG